MRLVMVGDVMLGRLVNQSLQIQPASHPWGDTLPLFKEGDWRACNLECALSDHGARWSATPKVFHFRSDARNVAVLKQAGMDAVSLANNHSLDYGYEGLFETVGVLDRAGIGHSGAGRNLETARVAATRQIGASKVAFLAFTDNEEPWAAGGDIAGIWFVPIVIGDRRADDLFEQVRRTKEESDWLVVSAHWGSNWGYSPPDDHISFAHALIDAGADVVFGHSAHVVRGVEIYNDRPILYSTGDFIDDYAVDEIERNDRSFVFVVETEGREMRNLKLYPTVIRGFQARRAEADEAAQIVERMIELCAALGTGARWTEGCLQLELQPVRVEENTRLAKAEHR